MKKLVLSLFIILCLPTIAVNAEVYKNYEHNFQLTFPEGYRDLHPNAVEILTELRVDYPQHFKLVLVHKFSKDDHSFTVEIDDSQFAMEKALNLIEGDGFDSFVDLFKMEYPYVQISSPVFFEIDGNKAMGYSTIYQNEDGSKKYIEAYFIRNGIVHKVSCFASDLSDQPEKEFYEILKSFTKNY